MSMENNAIFLSYASQDAEAARRRGHTLGVAGGEVREAKTRGRAS